MTLTLPDLIIIAVLLAAVGGAAAYLIRAKKRGQKCVGCPYCDACASKKGRAAGAAPHRRKSPPSNKQSADRLRSALFFGILKTTAAGGSEDLCFVICNTPRESRPHPLYRFWDRQSSF